MIVAWSILIGLVLLGLLAATGLGRAAQAGDKTPKPDIDLPVPRNETHVRVRPR